VTPDREESRQCLTAGVSTLRPDIRGAATASRAAGGNQMGTRATETDRDAEPARTPETANQSRKPRPTETGRDQERRIIIRVSGVRVPPPLSGGQAKAAVACSSRKVYAAAGALRSGPSKHGIRLSTDATIRGIPDARRRAEE
jgi:hypothetical protein